MEDDKDPFFLVHLILLTITVVAVFHHFKPRALFRGVGQQTNVCYLGGGGSKSLRSIAVSGDGGTLVLKGCSSVSFPCFSCSNTPNLYEMASEVLHSDSFESDADAYNI